MKIRFYLTDITYRTVNKKAILHLYGRSSDGKQIAVHDENFEPYFFVNSKNPEQTKKELLETRTIERNEEYFVKKAEEITKNVNEREQRLLKVFVNLPSGVPILKEVVRKYSSVNDCYEYDIKFVRRYLIDKGLQPMTLLEAEGDWSKEDSKVPIFKAKDIKQAGDDTIEPSILAVDIETYNPDGKRVQANKHPIIMIALYGKELRKVLTWKKIDSKEDYIEYVQSEADMLHRFKELIEEHKPDIISGYFSDGFDLPYIKTRADKYKMRMDLGLDGSDMKVNAKGQATAQITGLVHLDIFRFIRKIISRGMETDVYTLDAVSEELLGERKVEVDLENLANAWDNDLPELETYARYNLQDTKLTYDLCIKVLPSGSSNLPPSPLTVSDIRNDFAWG